MDFVHFVFFAILGLQVAWPDSYETLNLGFPCAMGGPSDLFRSFSGLLEVECCFC